jgi:precorrin-6Y C5,15-methyltransferase (decarboxylating)
MPKINVIGIGYRPLDQKASEALLTSTWVVISDRLMEIFPSYAEYPEVQSRLKIINNVDDVIDFIAAAISIDSHAVIGLIASGDPLFHGIGRRALDRFGSDIVELMPDLSCIQLASSRLKTSWDDAFLMSLHGGPHPAKRRKLPYELSDLPFLLTHYEKIFILTDRENTPAKIALTLSAHDTSRTMQLYMHVCEQLGYPAEQIISGSPDTLKDRSFRQPNIVMVQRTTRVVEHSAPIFGLREESIAHSNGLITKDEVRAVSIHKLSLPVSGVFWDIGAGSGSVSLEVSRIAPGLVIYSIEKDVSQLAHLRANRAAFGAHTIEPIEGLAPDVLSSLPDPHRVFIGGSADRITDIIGHIETRMKQGVIVMNAVRIDVVSNACSLLKKNGFRTEICQLSVARMEEIADSSFLRSLNPIFIIRGER